VSYLADTAVRTKPSGSSGELGQLVYIAPDPANPETFINVRLSNGTGYYNAGGTTISGGAALSADQGSPGLLSAAWPVKLSNGSAMIGVEATPLWITGSIGLSTMGHFIALSGSVQGLLVGGQPVSQANPVPVTQQGVTAVTGGLRLTESPTVKLYDHIHGKDIQFGAFGILKTTPEQIIADYRFNTASIAADWSVGTDVGGGWAIEGGGTGVKLTTAGSVGSKVTFQAAQNSIYQSGRGLMIKQSIILGDSGVTGNIREWGYYSPTGTSGSNGAVVQMSGSTLQWVITANGAETVIPAAAWDIPITTDQYGHLWYQQFEWLGVGNVYLYYDERLVHTYRFIGTSLNFSLGTPDLPVWYRNENVATASAVYMKAGCASVVSEGGPTAIRVGDIITAYDSAQLGKSVITGRNSSGGGSYVDVKVSPAGAVQVGGTLDSAGTATTISGSVVGILIGGQPASQANALPVQTFDPQLQSAYDLTTSTTAIYVGQATRGVAEAAASWNIKKTELDGDGNPTSLKWAIGVSWTGRVGHSYT
jgi:hypothetical protein